ncbi:MAG TPA: hypothetical protein VI336_03500, partial [Candidatus Saccharimonadales bacterium]|nr:hypothetical protein [Candidatus Saccharimonadales bacterium]
VLKWDDGSAIWACSNDVGVDGATITVFASSGTWTKSNYSGLAFTYVITTGGGGGGGSAGGAAGDTTTEHAAGGGGAGGTTLEMIPASTLGTTETVTVGTGGGGGSSGGNGSNGNSSCFGGSASCGGTPYHQANGGALGVGAGANGNACTAAAATNGGAGGTSANGNVNVTGADGGDGGCAAETAIGGDGGASYWGGGGAGGEDPDGNVGYAGEAAGVYGAGGGGASEEDSQNTNVAGGTGAGGIVVTMNYTSSSGDLAEWYETAFGVEAGDLVAIGQDNFQYDSRLGLQSASVLDKASPGMSLVGIVSTSPYEVIGGDLLSGATRPRPIALAGRVPVKVTEENGRIRAGDLMTVSATMPGYAMRSTKAGVTIGLALEDSNCREGEVCKVLVMVNTSYSTGALLKDAYRDQGLFMDEIAGDINYSRDISLAVLGQMLAEEETITGESLLSEIFTDRVAAGLEVITPQVTTDKIALNTIEAATAENIKINNDVVINGTLTVDKLKANQIEGLEVLAGSIGSLARGDPPAEDGVGPPENNDDSVEHDDSTAVLSIDSASVELDLSVGGLLVANSGLTVNGLAQFNGESIFDQLVTFKDKSLFEGMATFNNDSGGFAVIEAGQTEIEVKFKEPFEHPPVVTLNVKNGLFAQYTYKDLTEEGFKIVLKDPLEEDVEFAWTALAVKDARLVHVDENGVLQQEIE